MKRPVKTALVVHLIAAGLVWGSCGPSSQSQSVRDQGSEKSEQVPKAKQKDTDPPKEPEAKKPVAQPVKPEPQVAMEERFSFANELGRAHFRSGGLLIDFGDPSRDKYTLGDFRSGFRGNFTDETGLTFSYVDASQSIILFDVLESEVGPISVEMKAKAIGSKLGKIYLNGTHVGDILFGKDGFAHGRLDIEKGVKTGQNKLLIRTARRKVAHDGKKAAFAVDYVRIVNPQSQKNGSATSVASILRQGATGEKSLVLSQGESLTYYLPIEKNMLFRANIVPREGKSAHFELRALTDGSPAATLVAQPIEKETVQLARDLSKFEGQIVGLVLHCTSGEIALDGATLLRPEKRAQTAGNGMLKGKNVLIVLIDTLRADKVRTFNPQTRVQTPFLEKLAKESMVFDQMMASENWTKPSIASLLSGLYPTTHNTKSDRAKLPKTVVPLSEHLKTLGFATAGFVANGYVSDKFGFKRGWDTWTNYVREGKRNRAQYVFQDAVKWLKTRKKDQPFFLYVHTIDPHVPYIPPKKYWQIYDPDFYQGPINPVKSAHQLGKIKGGGMKINDRDKFRLEALYDGEITYHDDQFVILYDELEKQGLLEDTVIVVTSDHGEEFFEHGLVGHGHSLYAELLHVPMFIRLPGAKALKPKHSKAQVNLVDIVPTVYDILGVEIPGDVQGRSLTPVLSEQIDFVYPSETYGEFLEGQRCIRGDGFKALYKGLNVTLFDLKQDPAETQNVGPKKQVSQARMRDGLGLHLGQLRTDGPSPQKGAPKAPKKHKEEKAVIDAETKAQLKALGYMND